MHHAVSIIEGDDPGAGGLLISILGGKTPDRAKCNMSLTDKVRDVGAGFGADGMAARLG